ncbi:5-formyltetrahydrofolate cyclo-ligase [Agromyces badenianii]|uniref:5-formyltetrahydrofolate cyclo-ligase n=1 Tax=Agromyces badenianii TaxID=2080742 RepID=UPI000D59116D|nr:5-formyltetrahydrofolate cyclo-ligase [Agromyces badenianii]PWC03404.1 5-formyltetrahydrofolate cyclo-ligase [Agromyces badenianii]
MPEDPDVQKRVLRAELRERRQNMSARERELATEGLTARLEELIGSTEATSLSCYLSMPTEPDTRPFVSWAEARGIRVLFPVTREDGLLDWTVGEDETETLGLFGAPEAVGELLGPMAINDVDLIVVPAAAVDATGMRLGWGRGYFDKTLGSMGKCPPVYAVVFDSEFVETVPREVHDQPVNGVVTPTRIIAF